MENNIKNTIIIINYVLLTVAAVISAILNSNNSVVMLFLYLIILSSYTIRTYFVFNTYENDYPEDKKFRRIILSITILVELSAAVVLQKYDSYLISFVVFGTLTDDIVTNMKMKASLLITSSVYILSCILLYIRFKSNSTEAVISILITLPVFCMIFIMFYLINYLLRQNKKLNKSFKEIAIKNIEKDNLYNNLNEAYKKVENITSLRERNRIAAEIHDTVGHTLTTVLVELEASKRLMKKDTEKSCEKLELAQEQVRKGLNSIRSSVRVIEKGENILDFFNSLEALIKDTEKHCEVTIIRNIDKSLMIPKNIQKIIYSALIEGISNGIRHGRSTAFIFKLYSDKNKICFYLANNGKASSVISPGFGLRTMRSRVEEFNGTLETLSADGEGFTLLITFPMK